MSIQLFYLYRNGFNSKKEGNSKQKSASSYAIVSMAFIRTAVKYTFFAIYGLLVAYVMTVFIDTRTFTDSDRIESQNMVDGTAARPYVYRMLIPGITRIIVKLTPVSVEGEYNDRAARSSIYWFITKYNFGPSAQRLVMAPKFLYTRSVLALVMAAFLAGYACMQYRLAQYLVPEQWAIALLSPVLGLLLIPTLTFPQLMIYDPGVLFCSAICYYYMAKQQWGRYLTCFFVATISKETSIFMAVFFSLYYFPRLPRIEFFRLLVLQLAIYGSTKLWISLLFMNNIGLPLEDHLKNQIGSFLHPNYTLGDAVDCFMGMYIIFYRWQEKPLFARYSLWIVLALFIAYIFYGNPGEYRIYFDMFPLLAILVTDTLVSCTYINMIPLFKRVPSQSLSP